MKLVLSIVGFFCLAAASRSQTVPSLTYTDDSKLFEKPAHLDEGLSVCALPNPPSEVKPCSYQRPFPAAYHVYLWREAAPLAAWNPIPQYAWMPLSDVLRGKEEANELTTLATAKQPINCCEGIVPYNSAERDGPRGLALCLMTRTKKSALIPRACRPVLIDASPEPLLLVVTGYRVAEYAPIGASLFTVSIRERPLGPVKKIADLLLAAMKTPPFSLDEGQNLVVGSEGAVIEAAAGPRRSSIMTNYNEMITVHADVMLMGDEPQHQFWGIATSVNVLLNRQNTDKPTDWHPVPWTDTQRYNDWVASTILSKMEAYCSPHAVDFHTIVCGPHLD